MTSRLLSFVVWAAVAASTVYWCLRLWVQPQPVPGQATVAMAPAPVMGDLTRLLGQPPVQVVAAAAPVAAESRFRLLGVVAPGLSRLGNQAAGSGASPTGLALISVDGKAPKAVAVGRELEPGVRLLAVSQRQADLGAGGSAPRFSLALPMLAEPSRGRPGDAPGLGLPPIPQPGYGQAPGPAQGMILPQAMPQGLPPALMQRGQQFVPGSPLQGIAVPRPQGLPAEAMPNLENTSDGVNPAQR